MGGAAGGYISGKKDLDYVPAPEIPAVHIFEFPAAVDCGRGHRSIHAFSKRTEAWSSGSAPTPRTFGNTIQQLGFKILEGDHPIVPIMLGEASVAMDMSNALLDEGVYIKGLWYPVVPKGEARLRAQISAAFDETILDRALAAFERVGQANARDLNARRDRTQT